jgi:hypothetical protein
LRVLVVEDDELLAAGLGEGRERDDDDKDIEVDISPAADPILVAMLWPNLLLTLMAVLLVFFGVRFALRPLDALGTQLDRRDKADFSPVAYLATQHWLHSTRYPTL